MSASTTAGRAGLTLVEVLVAIAVLAVMGSALLALQAGSLRAARGAVATRELATALRGVVTLARLVADDSVPCQVAAGFDCAVVSDCLDGAEVAVQACSLRRIVVTVARAGGPEGAVTTVAYTALEAAPVGAGAEGAEGVTP